jgi:hypothetical protein
MNAEMVSTDNKLDIEHANVKTWNGRALPIEFYGELQIRSQQQVETLERVTCRDDNVSRSKSALYMKPSLVRPSVRLFVSPKIQHISGQCIANYYHSLTHSLNHSLTSLLVFFLHLLISSSN